MSQRRENAAFSRANDPLGQTMIVVWIGVAVLVAVIAVVVLMKTSGREAAADRAVHRRVASSSGAATSTSPASSIPAASPRIAAIEQPAEPRPAPAGVAPATLASFRLLRAEQLTEEQRQAYAASFQNIPRPPKLMHHLLSPEFVNGASSTQPVELITGEPLIAARVLTAMNSPMYGLKSQVNSIGQAVTYLGLNTVRSLCLQYILTECFHADSPERKRLLDAVWTSSALASELIQQLSNRLGFEDRGSLVSAVVLSFLGRLATTATMARGELALITPRGLLARTSSEQNVLGLSGSQIGRLLMLDWGLPAKIVDDAVGVDAVLVTPSNAFDAERGSRLALCYVCARLGERLAEGDLKDLAAFDLGAEADAELYHLRGYLRLPKLAKLSQVIHAPEVVAGAQQMLAAMRA